MTSLVKVCELIELPPGVIKTVMVEGRQVMVVNVDGEIHALDSTCTLEEADLSVGFLSGKEITCPLHFSIFDLTTGEAVSPPAERPLQKYKVKIDGSTIYLEA